MPRTCAEPSVIAFQSLAVPIRMGLGMLVEPPVASGNAPQAQRLPSTLSASSKPYPPAPPTDAQSVSVPICAGLLVAPPLTDPSTSPHAHSVPSFFNATV